MIKNIEAFCSFLTKFIALTKLSISNRFSYSKYNKLIACSNFERAFRQNTSLFFNRESASPDDIGCLELDVSGFLKLKATNCLELEAIGCLELEIIDCLALRAITSSSSEISELTRLRLWDLL